VSIEILQNDNSAESGLTGTESLLEEPAFTVAHRSEQNNIVQGQFHDPAELRPDEEEVIFDVDNDNETESQDSQSNTGFISTIFEEAMKNIPNYSDLKQRKKDGYQLTGDSASYLVRQVILDR
jgi:hypothetical protein